MRITRVVLSFFSIGFLAGSFEQAAGLGPTRRAEPAPTYAVKLSSLSLPSSVPVLAAPHSLDDLPEAQSPPVAKPQSTSEPEPEPKSPLAAPHEAGAGTVRQSVAAVNGEANAKADAPPSAAEGTHPPRKLRPFFDVLPRDGDAPPVPEPRIAKRSQEFILPFEKGRVTSMFNQGRRHPAIDLAGPLGTPVYATTRSQRVTFAGWRGGYGNLVITRDPLGRQHYYGHLHRIIARVGAILEQGETLGLLGTTGRSTGPHVHYEVRTARGRHLDPSKLLFAGRNVRRGYAWNTSRPVVTSTRLASRTGQPRPR